MFADAISSSIKSTATYISSSPAATLAAAAPASSDLTDTQDWVLRVMLPIANQSNSPNVMRAEPASPDIADRIYARFPLTSQPVLAELHAGPTPMLAGTWATDHVPTGSFGNCQTSKNGQVMPWDTFLKVRIADYRKVRPALHIRAHSFC